jgi:DNA mismatch endonuclease (patch repair protein)
VGRPQLVLQPPSEHKRRAMQAQRERDTGPEVALRRELHRRGLRYFVHRRPLPGVRREADVIFVRARVVVFVDGCFWHGCPQHATSPKNNAEWWRVKLDRNRERDADTDRRLRSAGWGVLRVWEHESVDDAANRVECFVRQRIADRVVTAASPLS